MRSIRLYAWALAVGLPSVVAGAGSEPPERTVIYNGVVHKLEPVVDASKDLWLTPAALTKVTNYELKPEGVCKGDFCFPIPKGREQEFLRPAQFNLSAFARALEQPVAYDKKHQVWCFGPPAEEQNRRVVSLAAPNFRLPDIDGKLHALSDYQGKKVLLITWASW